jgi:hypothetical protein
MGDTSSRMPTLNRIVIESEITQSAYKDTPNTLTRRPRSSYLNELSSEMFPQLGPPKLSAPGSEILESLSETVKNGSPG